MTARSAPLPWRYVALGAFTVAASLFIIAPLAIVVLNSFNEVAYTVFPPQGFSTRWYVNLFAQDVFYAAAWRSIVLATLSTAIALTIGTMAAYALIRYKLPAADLTKAFLLSPIVLPKIVLGVALFMFFVRVRLIDNYSSLLVTHVLVILPFVIAMVSAALANFDWTLQEAAMDLGAGPIRTFFRIILPQISLSLVDRRPVRLHHVVRPGRDHDLHGARRAAIPCRSRCSSTCRNGRTRPSRRCRRC